MEDYIGRPLRLYVYNNEYDVTREVTIQPSRDWGGQGAMGCVLGYGALHRLPAPLSEPVSAPGETMFDGGDINEKSDHMFVPASAEAPPPPPSGDFLVPAQLVPTAPPTGPPRGGKKKERHTHSHSPNQLMDDYFKEEEQKSRELDNAPTPKGTPVPPPPKGGPPKTSATPEPASGTPEPTSGGD